MEWPRPLPIYTEAEAREYAEGCAQRWCAAVHPPRPLTRVEWGAIQPPYLLDVPGGFWSVVHDVWMTTTGLTVNDAMLQWYQWYAQWFARPRTWLELLEEELQEYDEVIAELTDDALRGDPERSPQGPS